MVLSLIVAMDKHGVIGKDNALPWRLPADLAYFKQTTLGKPVLMGRSTYESIGRPLPGRRNLVLSRQANWQAAGVEAFTSLGAALAASADAEEVMVIGGAQLYAQTLPLAQCLYITHVDAEVAGDAYFPVDALTDWDVQSAVMRPSDEHNPYSLTFAVYRRKLSR